MTFPAKRRKSISSVNILKSQKIGLSFSITYSNPKGYATFNGLPKKEISKKMSEQNKVERFYYEFCPQHPASSWSFTFNFKT